ncbi:hypothetical protein [Pontibacter diazotrophicus]|nr:hypothetical protein [Pontibacter diazotrophicus]
MVVTVVLLGLAAACSLFEQNVEVLQTFELRIDKPADAAMQFSVQKDVYTNTEQVQKYANDIDAFVIRKISYKVKDFAGSEAPFVSGTIEFAPSGSNEFTMLSAITSLHLKEMAEQEQESTIVLPDKTVEEKLTELLRMGSPVTFRLNAVTDNNPIAATLVVYIDALMTVEM